MMAPNTTLTSIIDRFVGTPVVVVGDLIVDHYIWGKVNRISPEAPVVVVHVTREDRRLGGAGNVARNLAALGANVSVCGVVGDDDQGRSLLGMLDEIGADSSGVLVDRSRPTTVKTRVLAHSQQVVRVDREVTNPLHESYAEGVAAALQSKLSTAKGVVISDYAKGTVCSQLFDRVEQGYERGVLGSGKIPVLVDPKAPNFSRYRRATIIKPNRREAEEASGVAISDRAAAVLAGKVLLDRWSCEMVLITLGEMGMVLVGRDDREPAIEVDTVARHVFDVSGAGDTVSAVFVLALAVGASPREAAILANGAAGIVVGEVGTVAVTADQLRSVSA